MPVDAVPPAGNPCHACPTLCPTVALALEGVPPCVDENHCVVNGKRYVAVCVECRCHGCAFDLDIDACTIAPKCGKFVRSDNRNIVWKLETEVKETMKETN
jgi:hypothetical protein